ncbi:MAG TPA: DUF502 domain-containing protein, partial [Bauldia sp.]|nr:DUF502 domain-containing protein [Bauldia sp.]
MAESGEPTETSEEEAPKRGGGHMHRLRNYFLTGLVIAAPLFLTLYITWAFIVWIDSWVTPFIPAAYSPDTYLPFQIPGFGLIVALFCITLLGFLTANLVGRTMVSWGESMVGRMPLVRNIYRGLKQLFETALKTSAKSFTTVGLIQFPSPGMWSIVFVIGNARGDIRRVLKDDDDEIVAVFVPTTPTPLSGYLVYMKSRDVVILDMTAEDAAKIVISAGLVAPGEEAARTAGPMSLDEAKRR